jgi:FemAB-related protein (PEP-CTERM system-associated)
MEVYEADARDATEWDNYVHRTPEAGLFHLYGWRDVMADTFGLRSHYLMVREGGECAGILGLLHVKSRLTGPYVTSLPGAMCARDETVTHALLEHAKELVRSVGARYLILRDSRRDYSELGLVARGDHATFLVDLPDDPEDVLKLLDRSSRRSVRKATSANVQLVHGVDHLEAYYPTYSEAMRDLGTPTPGLAFFRNVLRQFPDIFRVVVARHEGCTLGGGYTAFFKDTVYATWAGMLRQYYDLCPSYLIYYDLLEQGAARGFARADLGRSASGSGSYQFKTHFRANVQPLYQCFYLNASSKVPSVGGERAGDRHYQLFVQAWRRLPLAVTELLGPRLRARMPFG